MLVKDVNALTKAINQFRDKFYQAEKSANSEDKATIETLLMNIDNIELEIDNLRLNSQGLSPKILQWYENFIQDNAEFADATSIKANENGFTLTLCLATALNLNLADKEDFTQEDFQPHLGKFQGFQNADHCVVADKLQREDKFNLEDWINIETYSPLLTSAHVDYEFGYAYLSFFATRGLFKKVGMGEEVLSEVANTLWRYCENLKNQYEQGV